MPNILEDVVGNEYGILTILKRIPGTRFVTYQCECGTIKDGRLCDIKSNQIISCGCARRKSAAEAITKSPKTQLLIAQGLWKTDKFSPFKYLFSATNNIMKRYPHKFGNILIQDLKDVWEKQLGICPYSGVKLILPNHLPRKAISYKYASIDRINSELPYTRENIQFVGQNLNFAKSYFCQDF